MQCLGGIHFNPVIKCLLEPWKGNVENNLTSNSYAFEEDVSHTSEEIEDMSLNLLLQDNSVSADASVDLCGHVGVSVAWTWIRVNNKKYCALLDTGAMISIVKQDVVNEMYSGDNNYFPINVGLRGISGGVVAVDTGIKILIETKRGRREFPFAIAASGEIPSCFILGLNFLVELDSTLDFDSLSVNYGDKIERFIFSVFCSTGSQDNFSKWLNGTFLSYDTIVLLQSSSEVLSRVKYLIKENKGYTTCDNLKEFKKHWSNLIVNNNILLKRSSETSLYAAVVEFKQLVHITVILHIHMGHVGREKLHNLVTRYVWHPKLGRVVNDVCRTCENCQMSKVGHRRDDKR